MYIRAIHREERLGALDALMRSRPLATLVTDGSNGLLANLIPFIVTASEKQGVLRGHLARANGQVADLREGGEALIISQGPEAYITPSWYALSGNTARSCPLGIIVVQARGKAKVIEDPAWLLAQIGQLTNQQEKPRPHP